MTVKIPEFKRDERLRHVIFSRQFSVDLLEDLAATADMIRGLSKSRAGRTSSSTCCTTSGRCCISRSRRPARSCRSWRRARSWASRATRFATLRRRRETKGETRFDSIRMFSSYFDLIVMRSPVARLGRGVRVPDERPGGARAAQRADRQRRVGRRPASHAGAAGHLHAAAHVSVCEPEGLAGGRPLRRNPPAVSRRSTAAWRARPTASAATSAAAARCARWPSCWPVTRA